MRISESSLSFHCTLDSKTPRFRSHTCHIRRCQLIHVILCHAQLPPSRSRNLCLSRRRHSAPHHEKTFPSPIAMQVDDACFAAATAFWGLCLQAL